MFLTKANLSILEAQNLFNEILNDDSLEQSHENELCPISGQIIDNNAITLPCGHKFDYKSLLLDLSTNKKYEKYSGSSKCPYCRCIYSGTIPYRPDLFIKKVTGINYPVSNCFSKHECFYTKDKEVCSINATIPVQDKFACWRHYKTALNQLSKSKISDQSRKCNAILKTGKSKGNICGATIKDDSLEYCKRHHKP